MSKPNNAAETAAETPGSTTTCERYSPAKWNAVVNDTLVPAPDRRLYVRVLKHQAGIPADHVLVRDHGSEVDVTFADNDMLDLADGNVYYSVARCEPRPPEGCSQAAKLAFVVQDRYEVTTRPDQTRETLLELFGLELDVELYRDRESPRDELIDDGQSILFADGSSFVIHGKRPSAKVKISINGDDYEISPGSYRVEDIKKFSKPPIPGEDTLSQVVGGKIIPLVPGQVVAIKGCEIFVSNCPSGGAS
jgi:hypothetical protein